MAAIQSHDSNRKISGYLFKEEASNVREREDRKRELERLAAQEKNKLSEAERLEEERQNNLKQLMKELQDAKDEAALRQKELRAVNLQVASLNSEKVNLERTKSELQSTKSTLEDKLRTTTTELATAQSALGALQSTKSNLESQLSTQTENNRKLNVELENTNKELKTIHWGLRDERLMIVNFKTRCAIDIGKDNWTRCAGWPMYMGNDHQYLKITPCDSSSHSGPWWIKSVLHEKYIEYTNDSEPLRMKEKSGSDYQKWQITVNNNGLFQYDHEQLHWFRISVIRCVGNNKMMKLRRDHLEGSNNEIDCVDGTEDDLSKWTILRVN
ncbi:hypothetical protein H072_8005 [Dactylellina haptotyla CBS 200.50]|uniref:Uncharacterized protein n=1 Tax=Dactylellina haptotyla (strain CBS 200.50) TaxID=1284197 RepID=S8A5S4_DACHA|nr:hypothetical protein H072_8005 [Dactylellina haptotyla CBS 200.50]